MEKDRYVLHENHFFYEYLYYLEYLLSLGPPPIPHALSQ